MIVEIKEKKHVRDPRNGKLLKEGVPVNVEKNQYWLRRVKDGDVKVLAKMPKISASPQLKPSKTQTKKNEVNK